MHIEVVTLFPEMIRDGMRHGVVGRALERGIVSVGCEDPRAHVHDVHRTVDDRPFGGGPGMVLKPGPMAAAIAAAHGRAVAASAARSVALPAGGIEAVRVPRIFLSAQGERFEQRHAAELAGQAAFVLVAGRYEGLDERVIETSIDREISLGDFVLSGGEVAALAVMDAVTRLLPGVLGDERSAQEESFATGLLDWPHYTRPVDFAGHAVPAVLQGGHHAEIRRWRLKQAVGRTWLRRPDLIVKGGLPAEASRLLDEFLAEREVKENDELDPRN